MKTMRSMRTIPLFIIIGLATTSCLKGMRIGDQPWRNNLGNDSQTLLTQLKPVLSSINIIDPTVIKDLETEKAQKFIQEIAKYINQVEPIIPRRTNETKELVWHEIFGDFKKIIIEVEEEAIRKIEKSLSSTKEPKKEKLEKELLEKKMKLQQIKENLAKLEPQEKRNYFKSYFNKNKVLIDDLMDTLFYFGKYKNEIRIPKSASWDILNDIVKFRTMAKYEAQNPQEIPFSVFISQATPQDTIEFAKQLLKRAMVTTQAASFIKTIPSKPFDSLKIFIFNSKIKKQFPQINDIDKTFTPKHINSAESIAGKNPTIKIFREEEILKSTIHETFHCADIDSLAPLSSSMQNQFAIQGNISPNEALIESLATLLNILIIAQEFTAKNTTLFKQYAKEMWAWEKLFASYQSAKILYLSDFDSYEQFLHPTDPQYRVKQITPAVEYHILKAALIFNIDELLNILVKDTFEEPIKEPEPVIEEISLVGEIKPIKKTPQQEEREKIRAEIGNLIINSCKSPNFIQRINAILNWLKQTKPQDQLALTGRMTLIEKVF